MTQRTHATCRGATPSGWPALLDAAHMRRTDHAPSGCGAQHHPQGGPVQAGGRTDVSIGPAFRPVFAGRTDAFGPQPEYIPCPCSPLTVRPWTTHVPQGCVRLRPSP